MMSGGTANAVLYAKFDVKGDVLARRWRRDLPPLGEPRGQNPAVQFRSVDSALLGNAG
jgi:hypothetical protein